MPEVTSTKYVVNATWDDAPHLTAKDKQELWDSFPPYQRKARAKGIPQLGAGAIYPIEEEPILVKYFDIPEYWPKAYALDVGWKATAAIWGAWDRLSDTVYLYSEYKQGHAEPATHVDAIKSRGKWIPGVIDPAARGRSQSDGQRLMDQYLDFGLNLVKADNSVEAGLFAVYRRLVSGRLKIFNTLANWLDEFRIYHRDEDGKIVKEYDHLMDATRYLIMTGMSVSLTMDQSIYDNRQSDKEGRNKTTGY